MVVFKVTDGKVTRKFRVSQNENFESLKRRIVELFPDVLEMNDKFCVHYTDKEGDTITISSDSEFQEVLSELPADSVWKLYLNEDAADDQKSSECGEALVHQPQHTNFSFHPSYMPFRMRRPRLDLTPWGATDPFSEPFFRGWPFHQVHDEFTEMDREFEKMVDEHAQLLDSLHAKPNKSETMGEGTSSLTKTEREPKMLHDLAAKYPGAKIKNFGSWEPKEFQTAHGKGRVIGPVGYYVSWNYQDGESTNEDDEASKGKKK